MKMVSVHEATTQLSQLPERRYSGQVIVPAEEHGQRIPGRLSGRLSDDFFDDLPEEEMHVWGL